MIDSPEYIIDYFGIDDPKEIDIEAICHYYKIKVAYESLTGCEGRLIGYNDKAIITVNKNSSLKRQRFSIAHELAHWILDKGKVSHLCTIETFTKKWNTNDIETKANKFAARLLMPNSILKKIGQKKKFRVRDLTEISDIFSTSLTATAIRFLELDLNNGILISSERGIRKWFATNPSLPKRIWPVDLIDKESWANHIKDKEIGTKQGGSVPTDLWINRSDASYYEVYEDSVVTALSTVLTLVSWDNESYLLKLLDD